MICSQEVLSYSLWNLESDISTDLINSLLKKVGETVVLKPLPYELDELEPSISKGLLTSHYSGRHQEFIDNLNSSLEKAEKAYQSGDYSLNMAMISEDIKINGNLHINHEFFWESLAPISKNGGVKPA